MNLNFPGEEKRLRRPVEMHQARMGMGRGHFEWEGFGGGFLLFCLLMKRLRDPKREEEGDSESLAGKYLTSRLQVYSSVWIVFGV